MKKLKPSHPQLAHSHRLALVCDLAFYMYGISGASAEFVFIWISCFAGIHII